MSRPVLACILIGAATGTGSAVITTLVLDSGSGPTVPTEALSASPDLGLALESLRRENESLIERIESLESFALMAEPTSRAPVLADLEEAQPKTAAAERELELLAAALRNPDVPLSDSFVRSVGSALDTIREKEELERDEQRRIEREERIEERIAELSTKLGLTTYQSGEMRKAWQSSGEKRDALVREARASGSWMGMREGMRDLRDETNQALARFLSPAQIVQYEEAGGEGGMGRGFRGGSDSGVRAGSSGDRSTNRDGGGGASTGGGRNVRRGD